MMTLLLKWKESIMPISFVAMVYISFYIYDGPPSTNTLVKIIIDTAGNYASKKLHAVS